MNTCIPKLKDFSCLAGNFQRVLYCFSHPLLRAIVGQDAWIRGISCWNHFCHLTILVLNLSSVHALFNYGYILVVLSSSVFSSCYTLLWYSVRIYTAFRFNLPQDGHNLIPKIYLSQLLASSSWHYLLCYFSSWLRNFCQLVLFFLPSLHHNVVIFQFTKIIQSLRSLYFPSRFLVAYKS